MSGFAKKVVERWNDWQLSVLVLLSLLVQLLLLGTAGFRRRTQPRKWSRIYFWALHMGSRFIATYSLGILSRASTNDANADIEAFWAALLLFHLGGPDDFTALSLEDNKIWHRHCFELSVKALTTAYVFSRYTVDLDFERFILPFLFISFAGVLKCGEQIFALKQATMEALIKSVLGTPDAGPDYADTMDRVDGMLRSGVLPSINIDNKRLGRQNSVVDAREADETGTYQNLSQHEAVHIIRSAHSLFSRFKVLFADGIFSFEDRRESQTLFLGKGMKWAFKVIEIELSFVYDLLYTKASVSRTKSGMIIRVASLLLTLTGSLYALFATIHATQYRLRHRCLTYTLLAGAVVTEAAILARYIYSIWSLVYGDGLKFCSVNLVNRGRWSGYMGQSNLITFCLQKLPSESELVAFSRRGRRGLTDTPAHPIVQFFAAYIGVLCRVLCGVFHLVLPVFYFTAFAAAGATAGAAVRELKSDNLQYLQRQSVLEQLQSESFWEKYKKTRYVPVQEILMASIFREVKKKEDLFNKRKQDNVFGRERDGDNVPGEREAERRPTTGTPEGANVRGEREEERQTTAAPFTDGRGGCVLEEEKVYDSLGWSFQGKEFDESLLLWHIATDLCFRQEVNTDQQQVRLQIVRDANLGNDRRVDQQVRKDRETAREISNYLIYIMVVHPLMLSSSTTMATKRCRDTCAEARRHFLKEHIRAKCANDDGTVSEENAHDYLLKVETPLQASVVKGDKSKSVLWDACFLAKKLNQITDHGKKWRVINKVWVEMLCYAAVQCGGYQHAERLREGGELITFVCLLVTHLGMGRHYRTEVGDAYARLTPFTGSLVSRTAPAQAQGIQKNAVIRRFIPRFW